MADWNVDPLETADVDFDEDDLQLLEPSEGEVVELNDSEGDDDVYCSRCSTKVAKNISRDWGNEGPWVVCPGCSGTLALGPLKE